MASSLKILPHFFRRTSISLYLNYFLHSEKMMSPASKIPPNRMSVIKINIGIGDSSFDESFFSFILSTFFPAIKTSLNLSLLEMRNMVLPFIPFISSFGELFKKVLSQFSSSPSKGNGQGEDNSAEGDREGGHDHFLCNAQMI